MPELIRTFVKGKMNKDLDERLVPNGEYRDALNLEISTSDTGNVGALQNLDGNASKFYRSLNPSTNIYTDWTTGYINALINPIKIGEIRNDVTEKIYWFIASQGTSAIAEYDQTTQLVTPVLVDRENILNFSEEYLITGINIVEGLLFWTDNQTEPKTINIESFKKANAGSDFLTHSIFYGADSSLARNFVESDITVIKQSPPNELTLNLSETRAVDANGEPAIVTTSTQQNFVIADPGAPDNCQDSTCQIPAPIGTQFNLNWLSSPYPFYAVGDVLSLDASAELPGSTTPVTYSVRAEVISVPAGPTQTSATVSILAVPNNVVPAALTWEVSLVEDPFFEFKFPRFAYRYKYSDNYYSTFSPFSEIAFLPGEFDYETKKGYNLGMVNQMKQCVISGFVNADTPIDVVEVDLLYKETNNQTVYVVETFKRGSDIWNANEFNIQSEIISSVVPSNQLLRAYDNVPRKAKSQEVTANRIIYGNYLQNFNLVDNSNNPVFPSLNIAIAHNPDWDCIYDENGICTGHKFSDTGEPVARMPYTSIKSQRTYQVGVVFEDNYGRQTPVFTSESAATTLQKPEAIDYNQITVQATGDSPVAFSAFRYYIKETSNEYYNLAMDRWYDAEDGNVWISFPSAERNKVDEQTFLELKKQHDTDEFVSFPAKYKVIAIENEAPLFLKETTSILGQVSDTDNLDNDYAPQVDFQSFRISEDGLNESSAKAILDPASVSQTRLVRFFDAQNRTELYEISSIEEPTDEDAQYVINIKGRFGDDVEWMFDDNNELIVGINTQFGLKEFENKAEFEGRFFVKLFKDAILEEYVLGNANANQYAVSQAVPMGWQGDDGNMTRDYILGTWGDSGWFVDYGLAELGGRGGGFTIGGNKITIAFTGIWANPKSSFDVGRTIYPEYRKVVDTLTTRGGLFRFREDPDQVIYKITDFEIQDRQRNYEDNKSKDAFNEGSNKRKRWNLTVVPLDPANGTGLFQGPSGWSFPAPVNSRRPPENSGSPQMQFLSVIADDTSFTSNNPGIFETEPKESAELELYYAASGTYPISEYGDAHTLDWHNCYSFGNGVESDRIRDDFNATTIDNGPVVSAVLKEPYSEERRKTGLIFSQIFNSTSGVNNLNQFIQAESITKDLNPIYGSIQKLHTRDTNLVTLCEDKCLRILANKDALFNADGNANVTSNNAVLGQAVPFVGEFGISQHPESFASYGYRAYFTDKNRGVVLRLSADGLEEISRYGMSDFFADNLKKSTITWGSFDDDKNEYNLALNLLSSEWTNKLEDGVIVNEETTLINPTSTVISFKESTNGWESRKTFSQEGGISLNDIYYTFNNGIMWEHRIDGAIKNNFYGIQYDSAVTMLFNEAPNSVKKFKTLNYSGTKSREYVYGDGTYEGLSLAEVEALQLQSLTSETLRSEGWYTKYIKTDLQEGYVKQFLDKENKWFQYIKGDATYFNTNTDNNVDTQEFPVQGIGRATTIIGPPISAFNVRVFGNADCAVYVEAPTADNKLYEVLEDCASCGNLTLTGTDQASLPLTFELVSDNTTNGILAPITGNQITFTPNVLNYFGSAGSFSYRAFNGTRYSDPATVTVNIVKVLEPPVIDTSNEPSGPFTAGDAYSWNNIVAIDPDHDLSELEWSSADLPSGFSLTTSDPNNKGTASITGVIPQGTTSYTLRVQDPEGNFDEYVVNLNGVAEALLSLEFVGSSTGIMPAQTWTNPTDPTEVVTMAARTINSGHGCNRGTYRLVANKHVNGGLVVGRFYVGNAGGTGLTDSFGVTMPGGIPTSPTGDVSGANVPSAIAQGNIDSLGNVSNAMYRTNNPQWGADASNSLQRFVTSTIANSTGNRYSYFAVTEADATNIATNFADPYNNCYVTFTFEPDTYVTGSSNFNTHADSVYFQVFQPVGGVTTELFAGGLGVPSGQCTNGSALGPNSCDPNLFSYTAFDVCSATFLPGYNPNDPANTDPNAQQ